MRYYEAIILFHPDQSEQVPTMIERYISMIKSSSGSIDRQEDWGRRKLAYPIKKLTKSHYYLLNFALNENEIKVVDDLQELFKHNDAILRHFVCRRNKRPQGKSIVLRTEEEKQAASTSSETLS